MNTTDMSTSSTGTGRPGEPEAGAGGPERETKAAVRREVDDARERLTGAAQGLRDEASGAGAKMSTMVSDQAERRKDEAAEGLRAFSSAIRSAADDLGERDASVSSRLAQEAARGLERLSDGLQARSVADMSRSIGDFGRENPAAFLTGCLLAGVAIGRILVASGDRAASNDRGYGRDDAEWRERAARGGGPAAYGTGYGQERPEADFAGGRESFGSAAGDLRRPGGPGGSVAPASVPASVAEPTSTPIGSVTTREPFDPVRESGVRGPGAGGRDGDL